MCCSGKSAKVYPRLETPARITVAEVVQPMGESKESMAFLELVARGDRGLDALRSAAAACGFSGELRRGPKGLAARDHAEGVVVFLSNDGVLSADPRDGFYCGEAVDLRPTSAENLQFIDSLSALSDQSLARDDSPRDAEYGESIEPLVEPLPNPRKRSKPQ